MKTIEFSAHQLSSCRMKYKNIEEYGKVLGEPNKFVKQKEFRIESRVDLA